MATFSGGMDKYEYESRYRTACSCVCCRNEQTVGLGNLYIVMLEWRGRQFAFSSWKFHSSEDRKAECSGPNKGTQNSDEITTVPPTTPSIPLYKPSLHKKTRYPILFWDLDFNFVTHSILNDCVCMCSYTETECPRSTVRVTSLWSQVDNPGKWQKIQQCYFIMSANLLHRLVLELLFASTDVHISCNTLRYEWPFLIHNYYLAVDVTADTMQATVSTKQQGFQLATFLHNFKLTKVTVM
jgi:hypothetical protein